MARQRPLTQVRTRIANGATLDSYIVYIGKRIKRIRNFLSRKSEKQKTEILTRRREGTKLIWPVCTELENRQEPVEKVSADARRLCSPHEAPNEIKPRHVGD